MKNGAEGKDRRSDAFQPVDLPAYDPSRLLSKDYQLHLLCQHLTGPHIMAGEKDYEAPKDHEWWRQVGQWLRQLSKILKFVPQLSGPIKAYDEQLYKSVELSVEIYGAAAEALPDFDARPERSARREIETTLGKDVEAEGVALRALHAFLREVDKTQHWCGLQKTVTNDGNILWLCAEHARFHGI